MNQTAQKTSAALRGRKLIKCPHCRELLMDLDRSEKVEVFRLPARRPVSYQEVKICPACQCKIGYTLIKPTERK
jgi:uncharacterized protein with PIN domain